MATLTHTLIKTLNAIGLTFGTLTATARNSPIRSFSDAQFPLC